MPLRNLSETLEGRLCVIVRAERKRRWLEENRAAIEAHNRRVAEQGILSVEAGLHWSEMTFLRIIISLYIIVGA